MQSSRTRRERHRPLPDRAHVHGALRLPVMQRMILETTLEARTARLDKLLVFQREDFKGILAAMAGYPVTIRLLDPPLHEFLPSLDELLVETTELRLTEGVDSARFLARDALLTRVRQLHEENPMLGLRVCRLGIVYPGDLCDAGARDLRGSLRLAARGHRRAPDVMIPGVGTREEMQFTAEAARSRGRQGHRARRRDGPLPNRNDDRTAARLRRRRRTGRTRRVLLFRYQRPDPDDVRVLPRRRGASFIPVYLEKKILAESPFQVLDRVGVGGLMRMAVERGRRHAPA